MGRYETALASDPLSARLARRFVRTHLADDVVAAGWVDTAELLVRELVTNAMVHAGTGIGLVVSVFANGVRVEVSDDNRVHPVRQPSHETSTTGRGLEFVELLAAGFGVVASPTGKVSWFSLGLAPAFVAEVGIQRPLAPPDRRVILMDAPLDLVTVWREQASAAVRESVLMSLSLDPVRYSMRETDVARANDAIGALSRAIPVIAFDERLATDRVDMSLESVEGLASQFAELKKVLQPTVLLARVGTMLARVGTA